ncbi:substrate-binding periplasmic protein [Limnohabitans sp. yimb22184]|uniref:substrate-binding periplasmic protein n=1 Tax=Limnohabitans sp. YIMB22184 TaxID=3374104 RepID=UPI003A8B718D
MNRNTWMAWCRRAHFLMALPWLLVFVAGNALAQSNLPGAPAFRVAVPGNMFAYLGKSGPEGVFLETMDVLLKGMGKVPQYVTMPTGDALTELRSGSLSAATVVVPSGRTTSTLWLSEPLVVESNIVVALKDKGFTLQSLADLKGKRLGARQGYRYPLLENKSSMKLVRYTTDGEMLRALLFDEIDAILFSAISDIFALRSEGIMKRLVVLDKAVGTVPFVAAFSKTDFSEQELQAFNQALAEFKRSPRWAQVLERNGLTDLSKPWPMIAE